jgi:hypothetical protein
MVESGHLYLDTTSASSDDPMRRQTRPDLYYRFKADDGFSTFFFTGLHIITEQYTGTFFPICAVADNNSCLLQGQNRRSRQGDKNLTEFSASCTDRLNPTRSFEPAVTLCSAYLW